MKKHGAGNSPLSRIWQTLHFILPSLHLEFLGYHGYLSVENQAAQMQCKAREMNFCSQ